MSDNIEQIMRQLERLIEKCNTEYYVLGRPSMSDAAFDAALQQLKALEQQHPELVSSTSPTRRVLQPMDASLSAVPHREPMLSLGNITSLDELTAFVRTLFKGHDFSRGRGFHVSVEPKVDGLSASWWYENGRLARVLTRGDGKNGEDITAAARTILEMPLQLHPGLLASQPFVEIRGEVYMRRSVLRRLNATRSEPFANTRNAAVGSIKLQDPRQVALRTLSFAGYDVICASAEYTNKALPSFWLQQAGVPVCPDTKVYSMNGAKTPEQVAQELHQLVMDFDTRRQMLDMDTDGCVLKLVFNPEARQELSHNGVTPRWAAAYKYPPEEAVTTLLGVTFQVGRHGTVTPVAELQPVSLAGSVIRRATLHNMPRMDSLGLSAGCQVTIAKAGEIIPQVLRVTAAGPGGLITAPATCPVCKGPLVKEDDVVAVRCANFDCEGVIIPRLKHAISKAALDVDGAGESLIEDLVRAGGIKKLSQLFSLDPAGLLRSGVKASPATIIRWMQMFTNAASKVLDKPATLLYALSVKDLGRKACGALVEHHGSVMKLLEAPEEVIRATPDLTPVAAAAWLRVREEPWFVSELHAFGRLGFQLDMRPQTPTGNALAGLKFVITGELSRERDDFHRLIKANGGSATGSVSGKTSYLIAGRDAGRSKMQAAEAKGVKMISEEQFWALLDESRKNCHTEGQGSLQGS